MDCKCQPWNVTPGPQYRRTTGGAQFEEDDADNSGAGQGIVCPPGTVLVGTNCMPEASGPQLDEAQAPHMISSRYRPTSTRAATLPAPNVTGPHIAEQPFPWALMAAAFAGVWILTGKKR